MQPRNHRERKSGGKEAALRNVIAEKRGNVKIRERITKVEIEISIDLSGRGARRTVSLTK